MDAIPTIRCLSLAMRQSIDVVMTDIDDTLTTDGFLRAVAYEGLERLHAAGIIVIPVTGRPAGWCDLICRQWPVSAVVGENGAFYFRYDRDRQVMVRRYAKNASERVDDRHRLLQIRDEILAEVSGAAVSADQAYREADLAIDFCEDVPRLPDSDVRRIVQTFERHGATAKVSSIHVNGWFGCYDKLTTSRLLLKEAFGIDIDDDGDRVVFVGDSPNDAPMFGYFRNSVGVANVLPFRDQMSAPPKWVTEQAGGAGFRELADLLLQARYETERTGVEHPSNLADALQQAE